MEELSQITVQIWTVFALNYIKMTKIIANEKNWNLAFEVLKVLIFFFKILGFYNPVLQPWSYAISSVVVSQSSRGSCCIYSLVRSTHCAELVDVHRLKVMFNDSCSGKTETRTTHLSCFSDSLSPRHLRVGCFTSGISWHSFDRHRARSDRWHTGRACCVFTTNVESLKSRN